MPSELTPIVAFESHPFSKLFLRETLIYLDKIFRKNQKWFKNIISTKGLIQHLMFFVDDNLWGPAQHLARAYVNNQLNLKRGYLERHEVSLGAWMIFNNPELRQLVEIMVLLGYKANNIFQVIEIFLPNLTISIADIDDYIFWFWNFYPEPGKGGNIANQVVQFIKANPLLRKKYQKYLDIITSDFTIGEIMIDLGIPIPEEELMNINYFAICQSVKNTNQFLRKGKNKKAFRSAATSNKLIGNHKLIGGDNSRSTKKLLKITHDDPPEDENIIEIQDDV
ncbi:hypothetical protein HQ531_07260 [bacterium]|nr:hypothetical protein [bacterium]